MGLSLEGDISLYGSSKLLPLLLLLLLWPDPGGPAGARTAMLALAVGLLPTGGCARAAEEAADGAFSATAAAAAAGAAVV
jgi:hypothetical protein